MATPLMVFMRPQPRRGREDEKKKEEEIEGTEEGEKKRMGGEGKEEEAIKRSGERVRKLFLWKFYGWVTVEEGPHLAPSPTPDNI